jgi:hypothetical protein
VYLLYRESIQDAKKLGLRLFEVALSMVQLTGLIKFKRLWGGNQPAPSYLRCAGSRSSAQLIDQDRMIWKVRI